MQLTRLNRDELIEYVCRQMEYFFPDGYRVNRALMAINFPLALNRLAQCINRVRCWPENKFDHLHSTQYCLFLYYLSNTVWRNNADAELATRLFLLNKTLNGIDCFYEIELPEIMFIGHSVGIVLAKATYSDYLVLYQNSTVGKNHGVAPVIEEGVVMYPNTAIIGRSVVRARTVLSQGVGLVNCDSPGSCIAFNSCDKNPVFKPLKRDIINDIFR